MTAVPPTTNTITDFPSRHLVTHGGHMANDLMTGDQGAVH